MAGKWYTDEEVSQLIEMAEEGLSWTEIARRLGRTCYGVKNKFWSLDCPWARTRNAWTSEDHERLEELAAHGYSASEIGQKLGRTKNAVIGRAYKTGVRLCGKPGGRVRWRKGAFLKEAATVEKSEHPTLIELREDECHWPVNNGGPFRYCGHSRAHSGTQYCESHEAMKWQPPKYRRVRIAA